MDVNAKDNVRRIDISFKLALSSFEVSTEICSIGRKSIENMTKSARYVHFNALETNNMSVIVDICCRGV